jgi:hypothetical protein
LRTQHFHKCKVAVLLTFCRVDAHTKSGRAAQQLWRGASFLTIRDLREQFLDGLIEGIQQRRREIEMGGVPYKTGSFDDHG